MAVTLTETTDYIEVTNNRCTIRFEKGAGYVGAASVLKIPADASSSRNLALANGTGSSSLVAWNVLAFRVSSTDYSTTDIDPTNFSSTVDSNSTPVRASMQFTWDFGTQWGSVPEFSNLIVTQNIVVTSYQIYFSIHLVRSSSAPIDDIKYSFTVPELGASDVWEYRQHDGSDLLNTSWASIPTVGSTNDCRWLHIRNSTKEIYTGFGIYNDGGDKDPIITEANMKRTVSIGNVIIRLQRNNNGVGSNVYSGTDDRFRVCLLNQQENPGTEGAIGTEGTDEFAETMEDFIDPADINNSVSVGSVSTLQNNTKGYLEQTFAYAVQSIAQNKATVYFDSTRPRSDTAPNSKRSFRWPTLKIENYTATTAPILKIDGEYVRPDTGEQNPGSAMVGEHYISVVDATNNEAWVQWVNKKVETLWEVVVSDQPDLGPPQLTKPSENDYKSLEISIVEDTSNLTSSVIDLVLRAKNFEPKLVATSVDGGESFTGAQPFNRKIGSFDLNNPLRGFHKSYASSADRIILWRMDELTGKEIVNSYEDETDVVIESAREGAAERYWSVRGKYGPCLYFPEEADFPYVQTPLIGSAVGMTSMNPGASETQLTLVGWIKPKLDPNSIYDRMIVFGTEGKLISVLVYDNGKLQVLLETDQTVDGDYITTNPVVDLIGFPDFVQYSIVVDLGLSTTNRIKIYVNGAEQATTVNAEPAGNFLSGAFRAEFGKSAGSAVDKYGYAGWKDEHLLAIGKAATPAEVTDIYRNKGLTTFGFANVQKQALWRFDKGSGTRSRATRRPSNFRVVGDNFNDIRDTSDYYFGRASIDLQKDTGTFTGSIRVIDNPSTNFNNASSLSFVTLIKPRSVGSGTGGKIISAAPSGSPASPEFEVRLINDDNLKFTIREGGGTRTVTSTSSPLAGFRDEWYFIAGVVETSTGSADYLKLYGAYLSDDSLTLLDSLTGVSYSSLVFSGNDYYLGTGSDSLNRFDGNIDEFALIVDQALTSTEFDAIRLNYRDKAGPRLISIAALGNNDEIVRIDASELNLKTKAQKEDVVVVGASARRANEGPQIVVTWDLPESGDIDEVIVVKKLKDWCRVEPGSYGDLALGDSSIWEGTKAQFDSVSWNFTGDTNHSTAIASHHARISYSGISKFTCMGWFYPESLPTAGNYQVIWTKGRTSITDPVGPQVSLENPGRLRVDIIKSGGTNQSVVTSDNAVEVNKWHFYAVTFDEDSNEVAIYLAKDNGSITAYGPTVVNTTGSGLIDSGGELSFGALADSGISSKFIGYIDDHHCIYRKTYTQSEISSVYSNGTGRFRPTREYGQWLYRPKEKTNSLLSQTLLSRNVAIDSGAEIVHWGPTSLAYASYADTDLQTKKFYYYKIWTRRKSDQTLYSDALGEVSALSTDTSAFVSKLFQHLPRFHRIQDLLGPQESLQEIIDLKADREHANLGLTGSTEEGQLQRYLRTIEHAFGEIKQLIEALYEVVDDLDETQINMLDKMAKLVGLNLERRNPGSLRRHLLRNAVNYYKKKGKQELIQTVFRRLKSGLETMNLFGKDRMLELTNINEFILGTQNTNLAPDGNFDEFGIINQKSIESYVQDYWFFDSIMERDGTLANKGRDNRNVFSPNTLSHFEIVTGPNPNLEAIHGIAEGAVLTLLDSAQISLDLDSTDFTIGAVFMLPDDRIPTPADISILKKGGGSPSGYNLKINGTTSKLEFTYTPTGGGGTTVTGLTITKGVWYFGGISMNLDSTAGATLFLTEIQTDVLNTTTQSTVGHTGLETNTTKIECELFNEGQSLKLSELFVANKAYTTAEISNLIRPPKWRAGTVTALESYLSTKYHYTPDIRNSVKITPDSGDGIEQTFDVKKETTYLIEVVYLYTVSEADAVLKVTPKPSGTDYISYTLTNSAAGTFQKYRSTFTTASTISKVNVNIARGAGSNTGDLIISTIRIVEWNDFLAINFRSYGMSLGTVTDGTSRLPGRLPNHLISYGGLGFGIMFDGTTSMQLIPGVGSGLDLAVPAIFFWKLLIDDRPMENNF